MNDAELLELASRACGYRRYFPHWLGRDSFVEYEEDRFSETKGRVVRVVTTKDFNPLTDDGDALRLAVQLRMMLDDIRAGYMAGHVVAVCAGRACYEARDPDPGAATRRAIVRAAAELGRA